MEFKEVAMNVVRAAAPRMVWRSVAVCVLAVTLALVAVACRRGSDRPPAGVPFATGTTSRKLSTFIFEEEGKTYLMTVGVNAARFHDDDAFIPLTVVLLNKSGAKLEITRESFTLVDPVAGARYGMATIPEVRVQGKLSYDRQLMDLDHLGLKLEIFDRINSNFFPSQGIVSDQFELHSHQYMLDNLYFPRPEGQLLGKTFELHANPKGVEHDLFVVFTIPEK
jgi:hypothetical protein